MLQIDRVIVSPSPAEVADARRAQGFTQAQAGWVIGRDSTVWASWERGRRNMPAELWDYWHMRIQQATVYRINWHVEYAKHAKHETARRASASAIWA